MFKSLSSGHRYTIILCSCYIFTLNTSVLLGSSIPIHNISHAIVVQLSIFHCLQQSAYTQSLSQSHHLQFTSLPSSQNPSYSLINCSILRSHWFLTTGSHTLTFAILYLVNCDYHNIIYNYSALHLGFQASK